VKNVTALLLLGLAFYFFTSTSSTTFLKIMKMNLTSYPSPEGVSLLLPYILLSHSFVPSIPTAPLEGGNDYHWSSYPP